MYRLGDFVLDTRHHQLTRGDQRVELAKKPYQVLVYLAENRNRLVTRQELLEQFWDGLDVYDQTLSRTVARIRNALGDSLGDSRYIETRWATGYQYIGTFEAIAEPEPNLSPATQQDAPPPQIASPAIEVAPQSRALGSKQPTYRIALQYALAIALIGAVVCGAWMLNRSRLQRSKTESPVTSASGAQKRKSVAVLTFKNLSGQAKNDWLGTALAEMVSTDLSGDGRLRVIPGESVARAASELHLLPTVGLSSETLAAVSRDLSSDFVVSGSYTLLDAREAGNHLIRVDAQLQDPHGEVITAFADTGKYENVFEIASAAKSRLIAALVLPGTADADRQDLALATRDPGALRAYMEGLQLFHSGDFIQATAKLERATQLDPSFALAHAVLSDVWASRGFQEKEKQEAGLALRLSSGMDREHVLRLTAKDAYTRGDWSTAIKAEQALFTFFPDNVDYGLDLANTQTASGAPHDADATLRVLRSLPKPAGEDPRIDLAAANAAQSESDGPDAIKFTQTAMEKAEKSGARLLYAHALSMQAGNFAGSDMQASIRKSDEARKICEEFQDDACTANILRRLGVYLVDTNPQAAAADFKEALALARKIGNVNEEDNDLNGLAAILSNQNDYAPADKMYRQLLQNARNENSQWGAQMALNNLGNDLFMEGNLVDAERSELEALNIAQKMGLKVAVGYEDLSLSQIRLARGNVEQAKKDAQGALQTFSELHFDGGRADALSELAAAERFDADRKASEIHLQESIRVLKASGSIGDLAQARLELARTDLDSGDVKSAAELSRLAAEGFASQHSPADESAALGLMALALEGLGMRDAGLDALRKAQALVHPTQARACELEVDFDAAAFQAAVSGPDAAGARALAASAAENPAKSKLQKVASEARNAGFILLATRAQQMLDRVDHDGSGSQTGFVSPSLNPALVR